MEDLTGRQFGSYRVVAPLGEGGMASVYKAYQPAMERYVALKVLPRHYANDPQFIQRFQQEARILARLQHPHILQVFDFGEADGYTYIVMPFVGSGILTNSMRGQPLLLAQIRKIIAQVGDALDYAHAQGLIHRDVKPSNVLMDERGNCLLTDFGLAKIIEGSVNLTATGAIMGTPAYMSPEQGLGQNLDRRSDIYSLGVILYEMATGRIPYQAETPMAIVIKHINDPLPMPRSVNPALPEAVERVILRALAKHPEDRFATVEEMVKALLAAIPESDFPSVSEAVPVKAASTQAGVESEPVTQPKKGRKTARSLRSAILLSSAGWVIAILLGVALNSANILLAGLVGGAVGGFGLGLAWRRIEPTAGRKQVFILAMIWMATAAAAVLLGAFYLLAVGVGGWLSGMALRRFRPALARKQVAIITAGWIMSWLVGPVFLALVTQMPGGPFSAILALLAVFMAGGLGSGMMFRQYYKTMQKG